MPERASKLNVSLGKSNDKADSYSTAEDIIELQDVRMSPIASLRNRHYTNTIGSTESDTLDFAKFPPSFRISRNYGASSRCGLRHRGTKGIFFSTSQPDVV